MISQVSKATLFSAIHLVAAAAISRHLITGGWLTNQYHLDDPNIVNLGLAIFEPLAVASVLAFWIWRRAALYRLMIWLGVIQLIVGCSFAIFFLLFALTWHPRMM